MEIQKSWRIFVGKRGYRPQGPCDGEEKLEVKRHSQFWEIARELARETGDLSIYEGFKEANSLHTNFYEFQLSLDDVKGAAERIAQLVEKLIDLTEEAMKEQSEIALEASSDGVLRRQRP
jgi:tryptophanyl-tRNA synthetase